MSSLNPFSALPAVLVQSIMAMLPATQILSFARCCKRCMQLAQAPFVWRHDLMRVALRYVLQPRASRLMRYARVSLQWVRRKPSVAELLSIAALCDVCELDATDCSYPNLYYGWLELLSSPLLSKLESLSFLPDQQWTPPVALMETVCSLANLRRLAWLPIKLTDAVMTGMLAKAPALSSWAVAELTSSRPALSLAANMPALPHLRHLHIREPALYEGAWRAFTAHATVQQLETLTLERFCLAGDETDLPPPSVAEYAATLPLLTRMHTLKLIHSDVIDNLLLSLSASPALRLIQLEPDCDSQVEFWAPIPALIARMLSACPMLHCAVRLALPRDVREETIGPSMLAWSELFRDRPELHAFGDRFKFESEAE